MNAGGDLPRAGLDALIFDLDGVVTDTASLHRRAWKQTLDRFLRRQDGPDTHPFSPEDYRRYVDGKPRYDGVRDFLRSRNMALPPGSPDDPPGFETVCAVGNLKNRRFHELLEEEGVERFEDAVTLLDDAREKGLATAAVTASRNGRRVMEAAGLTPRFQATVDGEDAASLDLPGKPDPAIFLAAARRLGVEPDHAAVFEDSRAGVAAARKGGFARVVGVNRYPGTDHGAVLRDAGAHRVVEDLSTLSPELDGGDPEPDGEDGPGPGAGDRNMVELPSALDRFPEIWGRIGPRPALLLDYDGTLAPIVEDPAEAHLPVKTHEELREVARRCPVAVISGRDLDDLRDFVRLDGIFYAGSHGLHLREPDGTVHEHASDWLPLLDDAEEALAGLPDEVEGVTLERKRFGLAVHYRRVQDRDRVPGVISRVRETAESLGAGDEEGGGGRRLRVQEGKEVVELRPDLDWDKGSAVRSILEVAGGGDGGDPVPVYVGDDVTDEDAFRALPDPGVGVVVREVGDDRRTAAEYVVLDPEEVRHLLLRLRERLDRVREEEEEARR